MGTKKQYKRQNSYIAANYDRQTVTMPKGLKERIKATGESVNGFINRLIIAELDRLEGLTGPGQTPADQPPKPQPVEVPQGVADPTAEEKVRQWLAEQEQKRAENQDNTNTATANRTRSI